MKYELVIEKKTFDKGGKQIDYFDIHTMIEGQKIGLQFKDNSKALANYLLKNLDKDGQNK